MIRYETCNHSQYTPAGRRHVWIPLESALRRENRRIGESICKEGKLRPGKLEFSGRKNVRSQHRINCIHRDGYLIVMPWRIRSLRWERCFADVEVHGGLKLGQRKPRQAALEFGIIGSQCVGDVIIKS